MSVMVNPSLLAGFDLRTIPDLHAWWDGQDSDTLTTDINGINAIADKSGNGRHLTAAGALEPGVSTLNGFQAVNFNRLHPDYMTIPTGGLPSGSSQCHYFAVCQPNTGPTSAHYLVLANSGTAGQAFAWYRLASTGKLILDLAYGGVFSGGTVSLDVPHILEAWCDGTSVGVAIDGTHTSVTLASLGITRNQVTAPNTLSASGTNDTWHGPFGEMPVFSRKLSGAEYSYVYDGLKAKWGL